MIEISIRYYEKDDAYYLEIRDAHYFEVDKKLRRIGKELAKLPPEDIDSYTLLQTRRETLKKARQKAQKYFPIAKKDIPSGSKVRTMYNLPETVICDYDIACSVLHDKKASESSYSERSDVVMF